MSNVGEEQLKFENAFQQVLMTLATRFINMPVDEMDQAIIAALRQIVEFLGGMRASINEISADRRQFTVLYHWSALEETEPLPDISPIPEAAHMLSILERGEIVSVADVNALPEANELRQFLLSYKIASLAVVPILRQQTLIGFVSTSWIAPHIIREDIIDLLHVVAEIFLNAQDRRDNERRIRTLNEQLEKHVEERTYELRATNERLQNEIVERQQVEAALRLSEERYRIITELISDYAFLCRVEADGNLSLDWITETPFARLTGYANSREAYQLYHPDDQARVQEDVARTLQGNLTEGEYRIITRSGEIRWLYFRRVPLWDARHEHVDHFYGVAQDITQRKQAEEALRLSEERYRIISEVISDYAFLYKIDADGSMNLEWITTESYTRLTGYTPEETINEDDPYSKEYHDSSRQDVERTLQGETVERVYRRLTKSGESRWVYMRRYPVWDAEQGRVVRFYGVAQDITQRKEMEQALQVSEERYRVVTQLISDYAYLYRVDPDGKIFHEWITADSYRRLTGYSYDESAETYHLYHPNDAALAEQDVQATIHGEPTEREYRIITKAGELRWIYLRRYPVWDEQHERVVRFYGVAQDITERKRIEADEHEQRVLAEALLDTMDALNSTLDLEEVLDRILANIDCVVPHNDGAIMLIEADVARIVRAKGITANQEALAALRFPIAETANLRQVYESRQPLVIPDVQTYPGWVKFDHDFGVRCHVCIPIEQDDQVIGFLTWDSNTPNSFNPKTLSGLQAFAHQTAVAITNAKLYQQGRTLAILEERQRLARDLHDAVTQTLFSASMIAEMLLRQWDHNPEQVRQGLTQLHLLTRGALAEMRSLLIELRPEALDGMSLQRLISQLVEAFSGRTGIIPTLVIEGERELPMEVRIALYRIAQEALNNVSKHARASQVKVKLSLYPMVELTLWDNGRGFLPEHLRSDSFGLKIMRERAELIGAQLTIASEPGKQTTLKVEWMG